MAQTIFMVIYFCVVGRNLCIEQHTRVPDAAQHGLSLSGCARQLEAQRPKELPHIKPGIRTYCEYEADGPSYQVTYDFERNTTTVEPKR